MVRPAARPPIIEDVTVLAAAIIGMRRNPPGHAVLVGISGVDSDENAEAGRSLAASLECAGLRVARIRDQGWHNLPEKRFNMKWPARHYYENALRHDDMFDDVVIPLAFERSVHVECHHAHETSCQYETVRYDHDDIDVVIVESLFLYKRARRSLFDFAIWVDCTFDRALDRAVARCSEPAERTVRAYETIYFPAQRIHLRADEPQRLADVVYSARGAERTAVRSGEQQRTAARRRRPAHTRSSQRWAETLVRLPL